MRARIAKLLIATLLGGTIVVAPIAPATAAPRPFTRTVEPWVPGQPPTTPPLVNLTAACIRLVAGGQLEAVFGYDNPGTLSASAPFPQNGGVANGNVIVRDTFRLRPPHRVTTIETEGPQAIQFLPGSHPHVFAVRFALNQQVAWQVRVPSSDDPVIDPGWKVTVRPSLLSWCGRNVPKHFAVVQHALTSLGPTNIEVDSELGITSYDVEISSLIVRTACSAGGVPLPFDDVVGWPDHPNIEPLPEGTYSELVLGNGAVYKMSGSIRQRDVLDVTEEITWLGPISDVTGRCAFGNEVVNSEVFWSGEPQGGHIAPIFDSEGKIVDLDYGLVLPGGVRLR